MRLFLSLLISLLLGRSCLAGAPVTIRFAVWDGDQGLRIIRSAVAEFEAANPNIRVKLENIPYGAYAQKLLAQCAANAEPDLAMFEPKVFQRFAKRGVLAPLDPFINATPSFDLADYYQPIVNVHRYRGTLYVLPRDIAPIGMIFYNKKLFREAGIPFPDGTWTWDFEPRPALREHCFTWVMQQLTKRNAAGKVVQWGFVPGWVRAWADTVVYSSGARYVDDPEQPTKWLWTDPRIVKAYDWVAELGLKRGWMPSTTEIRDVIQSSSGQMFLQGKVAMFQSGMWEVPSFRNVLKPGTPEFFDWDVTLAPGHIGQDGKLIRAAPTGGSGYGIMAHSSHPQEAWELLQWMAGPPAMKLMAEAGLAQPAIRKLALSEPWVPGPATPEDQRYPVGRVNTDKAVPFVVFDPTADYFVDVQSFIDSKVDSIMDGSKTASVALAQGQQEAETRLRQILREETLPPFNWGGATALGILLFAGLGTWVFWGQRRSSERRNNLAGFAFIMPWLIGLVVFTLGPMLLSLVMSTSDWDIIGAAKWKGAGNYAEAFKDDPRFWTSLKVSTLYTAMAVPTGLIFAMGLALLLNVRVRGIAIYRACFYLPALASTVASSLIFKKVFQAEGGLINSMIYGASGDHNLLGLGTAISSYSGKPGPANWLGDEKLALPSLVIMSLWGVGGSMIILLAGLQGIPQHYYEAAKLDGAGAWRRFRAVTFPLLTPALFFCLITGVIGSFQTFTQAYVMTGGGPNDSTYFFILHLYRQAFENLRMGYASALAWVLFLVILVFTIVQFRLNRYVHYEASN